MEQADTAVAATLIGGETLRLLPQRALYWAAQKMLVVADVHLGKAQTFQRAGIPVPGQSFEHDLDRLAQLVVQTGAASLLILGDFVHHKSGLTPRVRAEIAEWCARLPAEVRVILGNHDKPNRDFLAHLPVILAERNWICGPFEFSHAPGRATAGYQITGHLHPVVDLYAAGLRLPAFAFYQTYCVLPAFSYFTGGWPVERADLAQVFGVVDGETVVELTRFPGAGGFV